MSLPRTLVSGRVETVAANPSGPRSREVVGQAARGRQIVKRQQAAKPAVMKVELHQHTTHCVTWPR